MFRRLPKADAHVQHHLLRGNSQLLQSLQPFREKLLHFRAPRPDKPGSFCIVCGVPCMCITT